MREELLPVPGVGEVLLKRSSRRRTLSVEVKSDGRVIAHAPAFFSKREIQRFLIERCDWIRLHQTELMEKSRQARNEGGAFFEDALKQAGSKEKLLEILRSHTRSLVEERAAYFAPRIGVTYGRISVRAMTSRWGSCSAEGNLSFNLLLCVVPKDVADYVVIHELCHRKEMNHSARFWTLVARFDPAFEEHKYYLRQAGPTLIEGLKAIKASF
ncbi:MAG: M48 family metallopeptidase [Firmicutes bacterium]|nr:M48 family metallopeptidase [Bacillota bacterium]